MIVTSYGSLGRPGFQKDASEPVLIRDRKVIELSEKYAKTPAQIVLRYLVCENFNQKSNYKVLSFYLLHARPCKI